jgi:hypothetical protein
MQPIACKMYNRSISKSLWSYFLSIHDFVIKKIMWLHSYWKKCLLISVVLLRTQIWWQFAREPCDCGLRLAERGPVAAVTHRPRSVGVNSQAMRRHSKGAVWTTSIDERRHWARPRVTDSYDVRAWPPMAGSWPWLEHNHVGWSAATQQACARFHEFCVFFPWFAWINWLCDKFDCLVGCFSLWFDLYLDWIFMVAIRVRFGETTKTTCKRAQLWTKTDGCIIVKPSHFRIIRLDGNLGWQEILPL